MLIMVTVSFIREHSLIHPASDFRWSEMVFDLGGWQFNVHWAKGDDMHDVGCANEELKKLIVEALQRGETDDNPNRALYLFIRDFRPGVGMEPETVTLPIQFG